MSIAGKAFSFTFLDLAKARYSVGSCRICSFQLKGPPALADGPFFYFFFLGRLRTKKTTRDRAAKRRNTAEVRSDTGVIKRSMSSSPEQMARESDKNHTLGIFTAGTPFSGSFVLLCGYCTINCPCN